MPYSLGHQDSKIAANGIESFYDYASKQDCHKITKELNDEISSLQNDRRDLVDGYIELYPMHNKMQRSLIPIISKGLSYLFGTAT